MIGSALSLLHVLLWNTTLPACCALICRSQFPYSCSFFKETMQDHIQQYRVQHIVVCMCAFNLKRSLLSLCIVISYMIASTNFAPLFSNFVPSLTSEHWLHNVQCTWLVAIITNLHLHLHLFLELHMHSDLFLYFVHFFSFAFVVFESDKKVVQLILKNKCWWDISSEYQGY